jgi:integrase
MLIKTTVMLFNNVPMEIVSDLLGHSNMNIIQSYYDKVVQKKVPDAIHKFYKK